MPTLKRTTDGAKLETLLGLFLQAETDIVNEIGRLRSRGLTDYHAEAALERVQAILRKLENDCWKYVPQMVERQFYVRHPEARKTLEFPETAEKHRRGYLNACVLTGEQTDIVNRLVMNLMGEVVEGDLTVYATLERALLGRRENDLFRQTGLEQTALAQAKGQGLFRAVPGFVEALRRDGVTAFIDRAGRRWSLHTYGSMVLRTTSRQAEVLSVLTRDPEQDLYKISRHGTTCKLCAPLEGRVYSKSGADPDFPPLSAALGERFWNIHPNCLHQLTPWTPMGRSPEEIRNIKEFSSLQKNPVTRDPRTQAQIKAYRTKERDRAKWLADYRQWENYRTALGDRAPKTFQTFLRHKRAGDEKYKGWLREYRRRNSDSKESLVANLRPVEYNQDKWAAVQALIQSEQISKQINIGHQNKHLKDSKHYVPGKSYLYGDLETAQSLVTRYHGTGEPIFSRNGEWAHKEVVMQPTVIGVNVDNATGIETETRRFTIHYGKKGTHVVPAKEGTP